MKLEPGYHTAVVTTTETEAGPVKVQFGKTGTGKPQVAVNFEIVGDSPFAGQTIMWFGYITQDAADRTIESLRNMGFKGDDIGKINDQPLDNLVSLDIVEDEYQGKVKLKVNWVNKHASGRGFALKEPMAKNDLAVFAAKLKSRIKAIPEVDGAKAASLARSEPEDKGDAPPSNGKTDKQIEDDINF